MSGRMAFGVGIDKHLNVSEVTEFVDFFVRNPLTVREDSMVIVNITHSIHGTGIFTLHVP